MRKFTRQERQEMIASLAICLLLLLAGWVWDSRAEEPPREALRYKRDLTRIAHAEWGLNAPVSTFAAQIHQESRWRENARSPVGAGGLAQFMPATAIWISGAYKLGEAQPYNHIWALRALVIYDRHLLDRLLPIPESAALATCDRWAMVLSAYNGGLGWVNRDRRMARAADADPNRWWGHVEHYTARAAWAKQENRDYPRRILWRWEPLYLQAGWSGGKTC